MTAIIDYLDKVLVPEWRKALSMLSVWWNMICASAAPAWVMLTDDQKASILGVVGVHPAMYVSAAFVISIVLKMLKQSALHPGDEPDKQDPS